MKALSCVEPWAWMIVTGHKTVEYRKRVIRHRGPLAIHASKTRAWACRGLWPVEDKMIEVVESEIVYGALVGVVEVVDCRQLEECYAWMLANPRRLAVPVPWKATVGLFNVPDEVLALARS